MIDKHMIQLIIIGFAAALLTGCAHSGAYVTDDGVMVSEGDDVGRDGIASVGSRIKRKTDIEEGATPVQIYDQDEMRRSGAVSLGDFLGAQ
ncbi:MAG: hypothetical protein IIC61_15025 [Proteobacteria bacterium]|nr:hypothetical protein [Pseudomonadota bacterium]